MNLSQRLAQSERKIEEMLAENERKLDKFQEKYFPSNQEKTKIDFSSVQSIRKSQFDSPHGVRDIYWVIYQDGNGNFVKSTTYAQGSREFDEVTNYLWDYQSKHNGQNSPLLN